ncbi:uncharacterized protein EI90DRAFT_675315 [Cantharellus anzutake]|uniref:uncharacterized protein n=1 Tax=Cantharellus anzutake TaxID=1750568 RepID=UPI00190400F4|nr:uncharacterized protein EI90DRAFT_675315 [Cantharellus anzutake]KAF8332613.1 hypothetical protein EI90DRAFT_675315 [Cantharellus anzutake]
MLIYPLGLLFFTSISYLIFPLSRPLYAPASVLFFFLSRARGCASASVPSFLCFASAVRFGFRTFPIIVRHPLYAFISASYPVCFVVLSCSNPFQIFGQKTSWRPIGGSQSSASCPLLAR